MPVPIPGDVELGYSEKKIHLKGPAKYKVVDPKTGKVLEDIDLGPGGEFDGKVTDIEAKAKMLASKSVSDVYRSAVAGKIASPGIEVAMELPKDIIASAATRFVCEVADAYTNFHVPVTAYGTQTSYQFVSGEAAAITAIATPRSGHQWAGFKIQDVDYARFSRYYEPHDIYFRVSAEQINGSYKAYGKRSRAGITICDGEEGTAMLIYVSELTFVRWLHVQSEVAPFGSELREAGLPSRRQIMNLLALADSKAEPDQS
jgi:hypothetical protein